MEKNAHSKQHASDRKILTLCVIHKHPRVLLGMKKRGFGTGRWNGFGGKVGEGESIEEAAIREVREEAGVTIDPESFNFSKRGVIEFSFENDPKVLEVHIFGCDGFRGEPRESEEMKPQWFMVDEIPFAQMWVDDLYWMPLFLQGKKFKGRFLFDKPATADHAGTIMEKDLKVVTEL